MKKYCLFTNDVETTSIWQNQLRDQTGEKVLKEGLPPLLKLYRKYDIRSTFFFTGYIAQKFPDVVRMIQPDGHEVGCHGFSHEVDQSFDQLDLNQQITSLERAKKILEDISGEEVISFRAPTLRVNKFTALALEKTEFKIDSSIAPQRFDMFLSFGTLKKLYWLKSPRLPYRTTQDTLFQKGHGPIVEIPISALLLPYIGTTLRIFPTLTAGLRMILDKETKFNHNTVVFLYHPNENIDETNEVRVQNRRAKNFFIYLLVDKLRGRLKVKNLGPPALKLLENEIRYFKNKNYEFTTVKEYCIRTKLLIQDEM